MEEDGWREGSSEDKCALSFQSERHPLLEAHIYLDRSSRETTPNIIVNVWRSAERNMDNQLSEEPRTAAHLKLLA